MFASGHSGSLFTGDHRASSSDPSVTHSPPVYPTSSHPFVQYDSDSRSAHSASPIDRPVSPLAKHYHYETFAMLEPATRPGGPSFADPVAPGFIDAATTGVPRHWHPTPSPAPGRPPLATAYTGYVPHNARGVPVVPAVPVRPYPVQHLEWERRTLRDTVHSTSLAFEAEMFELERAKMQHKLRCQQRALDAKRAQVQRTLGLDPSLAVTRGNPDVHLQDPNHSHLPQANRPLRSDFRQVPSAGNPPVGTQSLLC